MKNEINFKYNDFLQAVIQKADNKIVDKRFEDFIKLMIDYCSNERKLFAVYRILNEIQTDIAIRGRCVDFTILDIHQRLHGFINTEVEIVLLKLKNPQLITFDTVTDLKAPPLLQWTDSKVNLVELMYAISKSINHGKADTKEIADCFQFFLQVDLGNYYDTFSRFNTRKDRVTRYLDSLPESLLFELNRLIK